jgi:hypothetical protein
VSEAPNPFAGSKAIPRGKTRCWNLRWRSGSRPRQDSSARVTRFSA